MNPNKNKVYTSLEAKTEEELSFSIQVNKARGYKLLSKTALTAYMVLEF